MFPSPQRGDQDTRAKTFRESLLLTWAVPGCLCQDCHQILFDKETAKACPQCRSTRLKTKEKVFVARAPAKLGFHDCRHHFISYAVMSGIDYMTIAKWVGHKDDGILIGKVYGPNARKRWATRMQLLQYVIFIVRFDQVQLFIERFQKWPMGLLGGDGYEHVRLFNEVVVYPLVSSIAEMAGACNASVWPSMAICFKCQKCS